MAVEAIQKNTNSSHRMNIGGSALAGATVGYSLKWVMPIMPQERDDNYINASKKINLNARAARAAEKAKIISKSEKLEGVDKFIKMDKSGTLTYSEIQKLKGPHGISVNELFSRINKAGLAAKAEGKKALNTFTKSIRSSVTFAATGMITAVTIAAIHNIISVLNEENKKA